MNIYIAMHITYIHIGTKPCEKLHDVICSKNLLADIKQLSPFKQTSGLESYHSVINHFAPKLLTQECTAGINILLVMLYI